MKVIRHQAIGKYIRYRVDELLYFFKEENVIAFREKDLLLVVAPVVYMKNVASFELHI